MGMIYHFLIQNGYDAIGVVLQENTLLNRSIIDNITLASPTVSMEQAIEQPDLQVPMILLRN